MQAPLVAVITKYRFCAEHLHTAKAGHWKGCSGPERRRDACADAIEKIVSECKSQKTYKHRPEDKKGSGAERKGDSVSCLPVFHMSQKRWFHNHRFFRACERGKSWTFDGFSGKVKSAGRSASQKACFWHIAKRKVGLSTTYLKKVQEIGRFWHVFLG